MNVKFSNYKIFLTFTVLLVLGGCTTSVQLRQKAEPLSQENGRTSKSVAVCIADKWEQIVINGGVHMRPMKDGYSVSWVGDVQDVYALADVTDTISGGSVTRFYSVRSRPKFFEAAIDCKD